MYNLRTPDGIEEHLAGPRHSKNPLSKIFFVDVIRDLLGTKDLSTIKFWVLTNPLSSLHVHEKFKKLWDMKKSKSTGQFIVTIGQTVIFRLFLSLILFTCYFAFQYTIPLILPSIITYLSDAASMLPKYYGFVYLAAIFISGILSSITYNLAMMLAWECGIQVRGILVTTIYRKALTMAPAYNFSRGMIINLMSTDAQFIMDTFPTFVIGVLSPIQFSVTLGLLYTHIGYFSLVPLGMFILALPINAIVSSKMPKLRYSLQVKSDSRIKLVTEFLSAIRIVKYYAWELPFFNNICNSRAEESNSIRNIVLTQNSIIYIAFTVPMMAQVATILMYQLIGDNSMSELFTAISYLNYLRMAFMYLPISFIFGSQYYVNLNRICQFLKAPDVVLSKYGDELIPECGRDVKLAILNGTFSYDYSTNSTSLSNGTDMSHDAQSDKPNGQISPSTKSNDSNSDYQTRQARQFCLKNINLQVRTGQFATVIGAVGSGKSSILLALLKECNLVEGRVMVVDPVAYVSQEPFITSGNIRENILFGSPYDPAWYDEVIERSALKSDLDSFKNRDMTFVAERGSNLSGGQRQRVSIARALYSRREVYILDDPFSAVDASVSQYLFKNFIQYLSSQGKTILLVTNNLQFLPSSDYTFVLKSGSIVEQGKFDELLKNEKEMFKLMKDYKISNEVVRNSKKAQTEIKIQAEYSQAAETAEVMADTIEIRTSSISWDVYKYYFTAGGVSSIFLILVFNVFRSASFIGSNIWLSRWIDFTTMLQFSRPIYATVYSVLSLGEMMFLGFAFISLTSFSYNSSINMHRLFLNNFKHVPMSFYEQTPIGKLLSRFSKDVNLIDLVLPIQFLNLINITANILSIMGNLATASPYAILIVLVALALLITILAYFRPLSAKIQRIQANSRNPIYTHFSESLEGLPVIRSYQMAESVAYADTARIDTNSKDFLTLRTLGHWFGLVCTQISNIIVCSIFLLVLLLKIYSSNGIDLGLAINSLVNSISIVPMLSAAVFSLTEFESIMNAAERVLQCNTLPSEAPYEIPATAPEPSWPQRGQITFEDLYIEYKKGLPVLDHINVQLEPQEKVGIVGRTGAGKSTLINALFRTIEPASGTILIDKIDIQKLGLFTLRSKISIIPQVPQLFIGTVRYNLDPFNENSDEDIWRVLELVNLKEFVLNNLDNQLNSMIDENGSNFSMGQRQLLSMCRCLLKRNKILIMDEATASLDVESDALIQRMIRKNFADNTVLTIAHRLITIIDNDRIMVVDKGKVIEFDTPMNLLEKKGAFYTMIQATGPSTAKHLKHLIRNKVSVVDAIEQSNILEESEISHIVDKLQLGKSVDENMKSLNVDFDRPLKDDGSDDDDDDDNDNDNDNDDNGDNDDDNENNDDDDEANYEHHNVERDDDAEEAFNSVKNNDYHDDNIQHDDNAKKILDESLTLSSSPQNEDE